MRILHVINGWPSGGIAEQTYLLCKHLPKDEFQQFSIGYCHFDGEFVKKFEDEGVPCIHSDERYSNFVQVLINNKIDIVHKQTGGGDNPAWIKEAKSYGIKVIETIHCPRKTAIPYDDVDAIAYTTNYTIEKNDKSMWDKMHRIQYALDLKEPIVKYASHFKDFPITVGRLGRIVPDKRPDVLLSLAKFCLDDDYWRDKIIFKIAGMIPQDSDYHINYGKKYKDEMDKLPNVHYMGFVEDKYDFVKTLDICINPVWETSFDIVFLEAMACGVPILTWDNSAAKHVVRDAGIVTEEGLKEIYEGLIRLAKQSYTRLAMGESGLRLIREVYSLDNYVERWSGLYRKVYNG